MQVFLCPTFEPINQEMVVYKFDVSPSAVDFQLVNELQGQTWVRAVSNINITLV